MAMRFDKQVVIITGSARGLGRAYAIEFAKRGALLVINDIDLSAAQQTAQEICALCGNEKAAVADGHSIVDHSASILETAQRHFGPQVHVLINNAGFVRDKSFSNVSDEDWESIYQVHLRGVFLLTRLCWEVMKAFKYGRIVMTSSSAGLYGNFGQTNYSAMKSAVVGLAHSLAREGKKHNILVNTIAPFAGTRISATVLPEHIVRQLKPEFVAPMVLFLCSSENVGESGSIFEMGANWYLKVRYQRARGAVIGDGKQVPTPEDIKAHWKSITTFEHCDYPSTAQDSSAKFIALLHKNSKL